MKLPARRLKCNLDLVFGLLAWLCVPLILWAPVIFVFDNSTNILLIFWVACIGGSLVFRRRPWRELWGVWLSAVVLWEIGAHYLFIACVLAVVAIAIYKIAWKNIFKFENADYVLCLIAWVVALATRSAKNLRLPGDVLDYELFYFPALWSLCLVGIIIFRKHPWRELWWVFLSGPFALLFWLIVVYLIIIGAKPN